MTCPEPEVADLDGEFPFLCGLGTAETVTLALVVLLRCRCSSRVEPAALQVRRVHLNHNEDAGTEGALLIPGSRIVVLHPSDRERLFEIMSGCPVGHGTCWRSIGDRSRMNLKDQGNISGLCDVAGHSETSSIWNTSWMPKGTLVESAHNEALIDHRRQNPVAWRTT